jgi:hypothetical protein
MNASTQVMLASVLIGMLMALLWLKAPVVPAVIGGIGAGLLIYLRARRSAR